MLSTLCAEKKIALNPDDSRAYYLGSHALLELDRRDEAVKWAEASPEPDLSELYTDVYVDEWGPFKGTSEPPMWSDEDYERE